MARIQMKRLLHEAQLIDSQSSRAFVRRSLKYGVHPIEVERLGHAQGWKCAGCHQDFPGSFDTIRIDHCHKTGVVRGLLCHDCNIALGWIRDNSKTLRRLANYIDGNKRKKAANG